MFLIHLIFFFFCLAIYVTEGNATQQGSVVGRVNVSDPDGDSVTFTLEKTDSSDPDFDIDSITGDVEYAGTELLNYDSATT